MENFEREEEQLLTSLFPSITAQLRGMLSGLYLAATSLAPAEARENDPELDRRAARLDQSYYQLLRLVNSMNAAARMDRHLPPQMRACDLAELLDGFFQETEPLARLLKLDLRLERPPGRLVCLADQDSIRMLLFQLLSNAFKFTPAGGRVTISLAKRGGNVVIEVADTGRGIGEAELETLFDRFRHPELLTPHPGGLGLGLALCVQIAADHDGRIMAESHLGEGSRFTVSFPMRQTERVTLSDTRLDYTGGFNRTLLGLADALPPEAFSIRNR